MSDGMAHPPHAALARFRLSKGCSPHNPQTLAAWWRGAVASIFADNPAFHGHEGDRAIPRYPEVHYRWLDGSPALFAFGAPARRIMSHPWPGTEIRLGDTDASILEAEFRALTITREISKRLVRYELAAPWIALNQENYARYRAMSRAARRAELDRILVGNLLTMSKAFGWFYAPEEIIYAAFEPTDEVASTVKGTSLVGFQGSFVTNLALPDGLAIGRSVSHGFGWFQRAPITPQAG